ncbi:MAG TPA: photosystem reaction center subunit H, partial [Cyanobacteria bacterium UBA11049]|nr:photosystem reaction center subunit H [Cyanobacteria bacterium UBA11049]
MALLKIGDFDPDYRKSFDESDIKGHGVYTQTDEKIGTVNDILVDEDGRLRYFIVDLGFWIFGKKVLLPVGRTRIDHNAQRVYAVNMTRDQADNLPEFNEDMALDYDYEERVRGVYRTPTTGTTTATATGAVAPLEASAPLDASVPLDSDRVTTSAATPAATPAYASYDRNSYSYQHEPDLYNLNEQDHQTLRLYEERLVANKRRVKTGEVAIGKHVETEVERVSVPVEKERVIVERVTPADAGRPVAPGEATFR